MEIFILIFQVLIFIIGLFLLYMFKSYYPKYFETKGSNKAMQEDIGELTQIVEDIKAKLSPGCCWSLRRLAKNLLFKLLLVA